MRILKQFFIDTSKILESELKRSSSVKHTGLKGKDREMFVTNFLKKSFPQKFVIETGEILDSNDNMSKQADIIVYDESMPTFDYVSTKHFLSSGVLAHIEVKSNLDSSELKKALEVTKSIKNLNRDLNFGPSISFGELPKNIPSFVFAYDGMQNENFKKAFMYFYEGETNIDNFVDGICVLNKYNMRKVFTNKEKKAVFLRTEKDSLMFFFEDLFRSMYKNWAGFPDLLKYIGPLRYESF